MGRQYYWLIGVILALSLAVNGCTLRPTTTPSPSRTAHTPEPGEGVSTKPPQPTPSPGLWLNDPLREDKGVRHHVAVLFAWDNSDSLSQNACKGMEFRKRFPAFFADTVQRISTMGGLGALKRMQLSMGVLGGNRQGWEWRLKKWESVEKWANVSMSEEKEDQSLYRGSANYNDGIESAIETLQEVGDGITNKVIVIFTDGDFPSNAHQWEDDLLEQHAHLLWVFLPCTALHSQNAAQKRAFEEIERERQTIVRLDENVPEYEWAGQTWRALWKLITAGWPSDESQRVQWVDNREDEGKANFYMPDEVRAKHGWMVLHGCKWRERMQTVPDLNVKVNDSIATLYPTGGKDVDTPAVREEPEVVVQGVEKGVVWSTYLVVQQPIIAEMKKQITNNQPVIVRLRRIGNWSQTQTWPGNIEVRVSPDGRAQRTMIWEAPQKKKCEASAQDCEYRWEPKFTEEGTYRVTFVVDHVKVPWEENTLTVGFHPDIVQATYEEMEDKVLVRIAVENMPESATNKVTAEIIWISKNGCCNVLPGEACHHNKARCKSDGEQSPQGPITMKCSDRKNSDGLSLSPLQKIISLELPREFAECKNYLPLRLSFGNKEIDLKLDNCKSGNKLIRDGNRQVYSCKPSPTDH